MIHFSLIYSFIHLLKCFTEKPYQKKKKKSVSLPNLPTKKKKRKIFLQYIDAYLTSISGEPCVHYSIISKKKNQNFSVHDVRKERGRDSQ